MPTENPPPPVSTSQNQDLKEHVKSLSIKMMNSLNTRTFSQAASMHMLPDFAGYHTMNDTSWTVINRSGAINHIEEYLGENPDFHTDILDVNVEVDEANGTANVWILRTDTGLAKGPKRETVTELAWVRKRVGDEGEKWFCSNYQGVSSFPFYAGGETIGGGGL